MRMRGSVLFGNGLLAWMVLSPISISAQHARPPSLTTRWDVEVSATNAHPEYPRPTMVRSDWLNLNGLWDFGITPSKQTNEGTFTGQILVPFPVESTLSGVRRVLVTERQRIWYRRQFSVTKDWRGQKILLHFDAADWETQKRKRGRKGVKLESCHIRG